MRILIVEDNPISSAILKKNLNNWGYETLIACNISEALSIILKEEIQLVITDWLMPGGNGDELCQRVRATKALFYTYIILVTSLEDSKYTVLGINAGADDFIRKPLQFDELHARIRAGERILILEKSLNENNMRLAQAAKKLKAANDAINRDMTMAMSMQQSLLPCVLTKYQGISIDWIYHPSTLLSGDIFNFFPLGEHHVGFYILDVVGHGIASAIQSSIISRSLSFDDASSNDFKFAQSDKSDLYNDNKLNTALMVVTSLNKRFQTDKDNMLYFTMIYGIIDTRLGNIDLCQAGHPSSLLLSKDVPARFIEHGNLPVGVLPDIHYESVTLNYSSGDRLYIYSDGITECENPEGEMFGSERLRVFVEETRHLSIGEVLKQLDERISQWRGIAEFEDDVSLLVLEL